MNIKNTTYCNWCGRSLEGESVPCNAVEAIPTIGAAAGDVLRQVASLDCTGTCSVEIPNRKPELYDSSN